MIRVERSACSTVGAGYDVTSRQAGLAARIAIGLLVPIALWPLTGLSNGCEGCHSNPEFFVQVRHLYDYYKDWLDSPHKAAGVTCERCHGGNPLASAKAEAHAGVKAGTDPASSLYYKHQPETCGQCHGDKTRAFIGSKHYAALMGAINAPTCTTCHRAMSRRPYYRDIVSSTCRNCHVEGDQRPEVGAVARAEEIFHRLSIANAYLGWTRVYFESNGWPGESRREVGNLLSAYERAVAGIHRFDLAQSEQASGDLLIELKLIFDQAWQTRAEKLKADQQTPVDD